MSEWLDFHVGVQPHIFLAPATRRTMFVPIMCVLTLVGGGEATEGNAGAAFGETDAAGPPAGVGGEGLLPAVLASQREHMAQEVVAVGSAPPNRNEGDDSTIAAVLPSQSGVVPPLVSLDDAIAALFEGVEDHFDQEGLPEGSGDTMEEGGASADGDAGEGSPAQPATKKPCRPRVRQELFGVVDREEAAAQANAARKESLMAMFAVGARFSTHDVAALHLQSLTSLTVRTCWGSRGAAGA